MVLRLHEYDSKNHHLKLFLIEGGEALQFLIPNTWLDIIGQSCFELQPAIQMHYLPEEHMKLNPTLQWF